MNRCAGAPHPAQRHDALRHAERQQARHHAEPESTRRGRELLFEMVRRADVLLENFAPGAMDALGVGWSVLHAINPRLIYATASGYGITGPDKGDLAMDLTVQAASGIMSVTGFPDGPPVRAGVTVADFMGGIHLYGGIMTALYERERSGVGRLVETAMQEAVYFTLAVPRNLHPHRARCHRAAATARAAPPRHMALFPVKDGYVAIHTGTEQHWLNILKAAGPRGSAGRSALANHARPLAAILTRSPSRHHLDLADQSRDRGAGRKQFRIPLLPGPRRVRGDERSAHARTRNAGMGRSSRPRPGGACRQRRCALHGTEIAAGDAQPAPRPAQRRGLRRLVGSG